VARRTAIVRELLQEVVADVVEVRAGGEGQLAQVLDLILVGDVTSLHLAAQEGLDPGPVPALERMKAELKS
jgi:glucose/mannose-6-phosphate isomerase